ncbi:hypothetical protein PsorP6_006659 [Peronosclerospora sorghi]|uniref:Uncharacterized protein n=1 Tax=Peronosclerospora sorghi TaxID=230839 RepID=A0ACC0W6I0_9STRA|nr:hypothetical protein PsorP6_006659 [Peronosclerospora sorghi]
MTGKGWTFLVYKALPDANLALKAKTPRQNLWAAPLISSKMSISNLLVYRLSATGIKVSDHLSQ